MSPGVPARASSHPGMFRGGKMAPVQAAHGDMVRRPMGQAVCPSTLGNQALILPRRNELHFTLYNRKVNTRIGK